MFTIGFSEIRNRSRVHIAGKAASYRQAAGEFARFYPSARTRPAGPVTKG
jgi:hypothetical protein